MLPLLFVACTAPEPLDLPADPAATGVPVGVATLTGAGGRTLEVWYPAPEDVADDPADPADILQFVPQVFVDHVGGLDIPPIPTRAIRDAPLREPEAPYPVLVFSHGFSGFRTQSVDYTTHLASRGYVVISTDHYGRHISDILPCLFSPALEGCTLTPPQSDPAHDDLVAIADWVERQADSDSFLSGRIDPGRMGLTGHSAGGASTAGTGSVDDRYRALVPMAGSDVVQRDVPTRVLGGTCDAIVPYGDLQANAASSTADVELVPITDAGHMAFSDICALDLPSFAQTIIEPRDDANTTVLPFMLDLATDGCPPTPASPDDLDACDSDTFLPLDQAFTLINGHATEFFDEQL